MDTIHVAKEAGDVLPRDVTKPSPHRPPLAVYLYLALTVLAWAGNWPMLKLAVADAPPFIFTVLRLLGSTAMVAILLVVLRQPFLPERGERALLALSGFLQIGAILAINMIGLQFIQPGRAAVLTFTMPLWTIPLGIWLLRERIVWRRLLGALVGLAGLIVFFDPVVVDWSNRQVLLGNAVILSGSLAWATGAVIYRKRLWRTGFWTQTFWQISMSVLPLVPLAAIFESHRPFNLTGTLVIAWAFTAFLGTGLAYWCWARALTVLPAVTAGQATMLVPVLAFFFSALFFGEPVTLHVIVSIGLILVGVALTLRPSRR